MRQSPVIYVRSLEFINGYLAIGRINCRRRRNRCHFALGTRIVAESVFSVLSFGTLIANYLGCFIIGILLAIFWQFPTIPAEWRLFLVTGFLGSLTTFSSFSAEVVENFLQDKWLFGFGIVALHLLGCLLFTALGVVLWRFCSDVLA